MKHFFLGLLDSRMIGLKNDWVVRSASLRPFFQIIFLALFVFSNIDKINAQIAAPELVCVKNDTLFWNPPSNNCGAFRAYNIYFSQTESGPYQILTTITNPNQTSFFRADANNRAWFYYMTSDYDCPGQPALTSDTLDNRIPEPPTLAFVAVTQNNDVSIGWRPSPSPEVFAYVISKNSPSGTITIDTVYNSVTYLDTTARPEERTETYFIVAIDRCGNSSLVPAPHNTMLLTAEVGSACDRSVRLSWNAYQNWEQGISTNKIWVRENNALPKLLGEVAGDQNTFVFENAQPGIEYCFSIQAEEKNTIYNATSNIICLTLDVIPGVSELVVTNATITPDNKVNLTWIWNDNAAIDEAEILRAQGNANLSAIFSGMPPSPLSRNNSFVDENANLSGSPITYQISTTDACDAQAESNTVTTIFLEVQNQGSENLLRWTAYKNEYASGISYELYRQPASGAPVFITTHTASALEYVDQIDTNNPDANGACYFVLAKVMLSLPDGKTLAVESRSNLACATQELKLYIPNAFAPNGVNRVFKPILPFGELSDYSMVIYNRWGEKVFETRNIEEGWEGKFADRDMPQGGYVYYIRLTTADGKLAEYAGMLSLIR